MTTYVKLVDYASKDALASGNPSKLVKGAELGPEFDAIAAADATSVKNTGNQSITGVKTFADTTDASSSTVGGTIISGGLAVAKKVYVGTDLNVGGHATLEGVTSTGATGTGKLVFDTSPTLATPTLGVASATSINKVTITAPATGATLTIADGATFATAGAYSMTLTATALTSVTLPTTGTLSTLAGSETLTNKTLTAPVINGTVTTTGLTLPAFTLGGAVSGGGNQINNVVIGASTPLAGSFTTLSTTGNTTIGDATTDTLNVGNGDLIKDASGNVGIGIATPDTKLHVHKASAGTVTAPASATLVVENNGTNYISTLSPDVNVSGLVMGSPSDAFGAVVNWQYSTTTMTIGTQSSGGSITFTTGDNVSTAVLNSTALSVTGAISATTTIKTGGYTVATLPAGTTGMRAYVTDATAPTFLGALTGGGAVVCPVFYNGAAWVAG